MFGEIIVDLVLGTIGAVTSWAAIKLSLRARQTTRMLAAPATGSSIAEVADGVAEVVGVAVPIDETAVVEAALSGTRCLWWRVAIDKSDGSSVQSVARASDGRDFHVEDGEGALARVAIAGAKVVLAERLIDPAHAAAAAVLLEKLGIPRPEGDLFWWEERIDLRADVHVSGEARTIAAPPPGGPFRPPGFGRERIAIAGEVIVRVGDPRAIAAQLEAQANESRHVARPLAALGVAFGGAFLAVLWDILGG